MPISPSDRANQNIFRRRAPEIVGSSYNNSSTSPTGNSESSGRAIGVIPAATATRPPRHPGSINTGSELRSAPTLRRETQGEHAITGPTRQVDLSRLRSAPLPEIAGNALHRHPTTKLDRLMAILSEDLKANRQAIEPSQSSPLRSNADPMATTITPPPYDSRSTEPLIASNPSRGNHYLDDQATQLSGDNAIHPTSEENASADAALTTTENQGEIITPELNTETTSSRHVETLFQHLARHDPFPGNRPRAYALSNSTPSSNRTDELTDSSIEFQPVNVELDPLASSFNSLTISDTSSEDSSFLNIVDIVTSAEPTSLTPTASSLAWRDLPAYDATPDFIQQHQSDVCPLTNRELRHMIENENGQPVIVTAPNETASRTGESQSRQKTSIFVFDYAGLLDLQNRTDPSLSCLGLVYVPNSEHLIHLGSPYVRSFIAGFAPLAHPQRQETLQAYRVDIDTVRQYLRRNNSPEAPSPRREQLKTNERQIDEN